MEEVVQRDTLKAAWRRVRQNPGSPSVDGMRTDELLPYVRVHWPRIREELLAGTYRPQPVKRQEIPKTSGGVRQLGIPTVLDRFIQQAMVQVLQPRFDPSVSEHRDGFRPGRRARAKRSRRRSGTWRTAGATWWTWRWRRVLTASITMG
jgi:RNA-directed DNA polymerase